jgi:hypothetical protein
VLSQVTIVPVAGRAELMRFIRLPQKLHAADASFVAPLERGQLDVLCADRNPWFEHAEAQLFLAVRDGRDIGRISAHVDQLVKDQRVGHFGFVAAEDDPAVFAALFGAAEEWLRGRGRSIVLGPFNFSVNEQAGLLIKGFNTPPMVFMPHDSPYAGFRVQEQGYEKAGDLTAYLYDTRRELPEAVRRLITRPRANLRVRQFDMHNLETEIDSMIGMFNEAWSDLWGFVPFTAAEARHLARRLKPLVDPALTAILELRGRSVGFGIMLPNHNEITGDFGGSLHPWNFIRMKWRARSGVRSARVPMLGVGSVCRSGLASGIAPWMIVDSLHKGARARGVRDVELSWIREDNMPMRRIVEALGSDPYKTYRIYQKGLA